jgi:DNA-binding MarR family transcriptional regulator
MLGSVWGLLTQASRTRGGLPVLPPSQARVLHLVTTSEEITPTRLAVQMGLSRPMVSEVIRSLEENELVVRRRSTSDGRSVIISPTSRGRYVQQSFRHGLVDILAEAFDSMTHGDVHRIMDSVAALGRLHERLSAIAEREEAATDRGREVVAAADADS